MCQRTCHTHGGGGGETAAAAHKPHDATTDSSHSNWPLRDMAFAPVHHCVIGAGDNHDS